ncbi:MAG: hypothetical protein ABSD98_09600 [Candidatus Korobacteraceae bacterium]|jgi:hypothetical protein
MERLRMVLAAGIGLVVGAVLTFVCISLQQRNGKDAFEQKVRCDEIAKQYERDNSSQAGSAEVDEVVFSTARNSCVGKVVVTGNFERYAVVDLLSREEGWSEMCNSQTNECANRGDELLKERDKHFKEFVSSTGAR